MSAVVLVVLSVLIVAPGVRSVGPRLARLQGLGRLGGGGPRRRGPAGRLSDRRAALVAGLAGLGLAAGVGVVVGPVLGIAAALVLVTVVALAVAARRARAQRTRRAGLVTALRGLVADLQAGARPADALLGAAAISHAEAFGPAAQVAAAGGDVPAALTAAGFAGLSGLAHAWRLSDQTGAPLAEVLARLADDVGAEERQRRAVAVALAGPRSSALMLAGLPALGLGLGVAMGANPFALLIGTPAGQMLCCIGIGFDVVGVVWTSELIRRAQRS